MSNVLTPVVNNAEGGSDIKKLRARQLDVVSLPGLKPSELQTILKSFQYTQIEFASILGVSRVRVSNVLRGDPRSVVPDHAESRVPREFEVGALAIKLGIVRKIEGGISGPRPLLPKEFANRRIAAGVALVQLEQLTDISRQRISRVESGHLPSLANLHGRAIVPHSLTLTLTMIESKILVLEEGSLPLK
jgi:transcriptional regulator with XRE-family HTH domain